MLWYLYQIEGYIDQKVKGEAKMTTTETTTEEYRILAEYGLIEPEDVKHGINRINDERYTEGRTDYIETVEDFLFIL